MDKLGEIRTFRKLQKMDDWYPNRKQRVVEWSVPWKQQWVLTGSDGLVPAAVVRGSLALGGAGAGNAG